ncbi:MAG: hypothetical protein NTX81_03620, partial [Candidatus Bathyarchaeota archaeon]|nr:hypothetical protein [Candidatus Bathyarchaeota archaeon]
GHVLTDTRAKMRSRVKEFGRECPVLIALIIFLVALAFGQVLKMGFAVLSVLAIVSGFALPLVYGSRLGLAPHEAVILSLVILTFLSYGALCLLFFFARKLIVRSYMKKLKKTSVYRMLTSGAGRFGTYGVLALSTFLVGWWAAVGIAFVLQLETPYAISAIFVGLVAGGLLTWLLYMGIGGIVGNPFISAVLFLGVGLAIGAITSLVLDRMRKRKP